MFFFVRVLCIFLFFRIVGARMHPIPMRTVPSPGTLKWIFVLFYTSFSFVKTRAYDSFSETQSTVLVVLSAPTETSDESSSLCANILLRFKYTSC